MWVADLTHVPIAAGVLYLAVILDVFSRRVVGWSMADHMRTALVLGALEMALIRQHPPAGLIHHSDHGSQYTAGAFASRCQVAQIRQSMGSVGDCYDNALAESFFTTLKGDLLSSQSFRTQGEARTALFTYLEIFYNRQRRHSALGYLTPKDFDRRYTQQQHQHLA